MDTVNTAVKTMQVLMKSAKQRKDSIESYMEGGRQDLVDKEQKEVNEKTAKMRYTHLTQLTRILGTKYCKYPPP